MTEKYLSNILHFYDEDLLIYSAVAGQLTFKDGYNYNLEVPVFISLKIGIAMIGLILNISGNKHFSVVKQMI